MEAWYDVNEIPRGVGIVAWLNAAPEFVFAVLIAGLGSLLFDSRSISALIMASPLYFVVFIGVDRLYRSLLLNYCIWAGRFPVNAVTIGPFTVKRNPVRLRVRWNVPQSYFFGCLTTPFPQSLIAGRDQQRAFASVRRSTRIAILVALSILVCTLLGNTAAVFHLAAWGAFWITLRGISFVRTLGRSLAQFSRSPDPERALAIARAAAQSERGSLAQLGDADILAMIRTQDETFDELISHVIASDVRIAQGEPLLAARHVRRAFAIAHLLRRLPLAAADEMLAAVCHRAAFIAAAYANDLDFAFRALATGGAPYLFGTDHAKAMTAIWIRLGHRQEATRWLRRAEQEAAFWSSGSVQQEDQQMADLRAVFAQNDLAPLDQSGIGADFFAKSERPVFFRYSPRFSWTLKPTYWGSTMLYLPVLLFAALIADSTAATVLLPPAIFLVIAMRSFRYGLWMLLNGAAIEFGREGIRYRIGPRLRWVPWSAIQRYGRIGHFLTCPGLVVSRDAIRRAGGSQRELAFIPTGNFKRAWPAADLDSELRRHLPHLFAPANGSD